MLLDGSSTDNFHKYEQKSDYGNLKELILQYMNSQKLDHN